GWIYAQAPSEPVSAAKVGTAIVTYGASGTTRPTLPGDYVATFTVPESENYNELTKDVPFTIAPAPNLQAGLIAEIKWSYLRATGTYFAQLSVVCTNGIETGISSLRFMFADRIGSDGKQEAALWDSSKRTANSNTLQYDGETYRYVELNASKITENNKPVTFGVSDVNATTIPVSERIIEMYVHRRVVPEIGNEGAAKVGDFVGFVTWESDGKTYSIPVVAGTSTLYSSFKAMRTLSMPLSREKLNNSLAMGVPLDSNSSPYCRLTEFSVNDLTISGKVEVGAISSENQIEKGSIGINSSVTLLGASTLGSPFIEVTTVNTAEDGSFTIEKPEEAFFFKIRIDILDIVK
ncbi:MAG: hypothetical protein J6V70_06905, partial [Kiritimatiellae bacterium]|nr:hypothetical protein [Kiritimatiellia bacterium]